MSSAKTHSSRRKTRHAPSWWSLFSRDQHRQLQDEIRFYRDLESALAEKALVTKAQEKPPPSPNVSSPQIGGPTTNPEKSTSAPLNNTLAEAAKETSSTISNSAADKNKKSKRSKKQDKPAKTERAHPERHKADQLPAEERIERKSNQPAHKQQPYEHDKSPPTPREARKVQFAIGTKKAASSPMAYSSSPNSSKDSYIDAPTTSSSTRAKGLKPILKGKGESSGFKEPAKKDTDIDFDDFWSDDSEGASAVDINEIPATIGLRGILKNRNPYARAIIYGANASRQSRPHMPTGSQHKLTRGKAPQHSLTFQDREWAKHSSFGPATYGRGDQVPSHTKRMSSTRRQTDDIHEHESTTDYVHQRPRSQAKAQDSRVKSALRQASYNKKLNSRSPSESPSTPRSPHARNERRRREDDYRRSSESVGPVFVFRPSDAAADEPDFIVSNQADLDAARRDYHRRQKSSTSASGSHRGRRIEAQTKRDRRRVPCYKDDPESETTSESESSDDYLWYELIVFMAPCCFGDMLMSYLQKRSRLLPVTGLFRVTNFVHLNSSTTYRGCMRTRLSVRYFDLLQPFLRPSSIVLKFTLPA